MFSVNNPSVNFQTRRRGLLSLNVVQRIEQQHEIALKRDKRKLSKPSRYDLMVRGLDKLANDYNYYQMSELQQNEFDKIIAEACCQFIKKGKIKYDRDSMYYNDHSAFWNIFFNKLNSVKTLDLFTHAAAAVLTEGPIPDIQQVNKVAAGVYQANQELDNTIYAVQGLRGAMEQMADKTLMLAQEELNTTQAICDAAETFLDRSRARQKQRQLLAGLVAQPTGRLSSRLVLTNAQPGGASGLSTIGLFSSPPQPTNPPSVPSHPAPNFGGRM